MGPLPERSRRHWIALACVLALAFGLRLGWIALAKLDPSDGDYFDMVFYHLTAHRLLDGAGLHAARWNADRRLASALSDAAGGGLRDQRRQRRSGAARESRSSAR